MNVRGKTRYNKIVKRKVGFEEKRQLVFGQDCQENKE